MLAERAGVRERVVSVPVGSTRRLNRGRRGRGRGQQELLGIPGLACAAEWFWSAVATPAFALTIPGLVVVLVVLDAGLHPGKRLEMDERQAAALRRDDVEDGAPPAQRPRPRRRRRDRPTSAAQSVRRLTSGQPAQ